MFIIGPFEKIAAESRFINDHVRDVLCVLYRDARMIDSLMLVAVWKRVETKLNFVQIVRESKERHVSSLDHTHELVLAPRLLI